MKKKGLAALCVIAVLLLAAGAWRCAARQGEKGIAADLPLIEPSAQRDFMRTDLVYDAGTRTMRGTQTLTATNRTDAPLSEIVLRLYPNGPDFGSVAISGVTADGQSVPFERDENDDTLLRISLDWQPAQTVALSFTLMLTHQKADGAAIVTLPALAMLTEDGWQTEGYDALAGTLGAQAFDYVITLEAGKEQHTIQMQGARDASFALMPGGKIRQKKIGGALVTALAPSVSQAGRLLDDAQQAMENLEDIGLAYPFPALTVVSADTGWADGAAFSGMIAIGEEKGREAFLRRLTRLIARQTFGVSVGNDMYGAPWLSHTLASTAELLSYRQRCGGAAFETRFFEEIEVATRLTRPYGVTVGAGVDRFGGDSEMTQVLRDQGAAMLLGIGQAIGYDALVQVLCSYAVDNAGRIADRQDFEAALHGISQSSWTGYLTDELSY